MYTKKIRIIIIHNIYKLKIFLFLFLFYTQIINKRQMNKL